MAVVVTGRRFADPRCLHGCKYGALPKSLAAYPGTIWRSAQVGCVLCLSEAYLIYMPK